jgi:hypothetical protein
VHEPIFDQVTGLIVLFVLGAFTLFFRRLIGDLDAARKAITELDEKLQILDRRVAVIIERDRNRRLQDYENDYNDNSDNH